jgi:beta propeller domain-containing protein
MRLRALVVAIAPLVVLGAALTGAAADARAPAPSRLTAFGDCRSFAGYMSAHALPLVGRYGPRVGIAVGAAPPVPGRIADGQGAPGPEVSGTNVQEDGVDEPDTVKTDGRTLFVATAGRISAVDVRSARPKLLDSLRLAPGATSELLLHGNRLLALSRRIAVPVAGRETGAPTLLPVPVATSLTEIDVSSPGRLRVVRTLDLDGSYLTARLVGSTARVVVVSSPLVALPLLPSTGAGAAGAATRNREVVRSAGATRWLPRFTVRNAHGAAVRSGRLLECGDVLRPPSFAGLGLVTILTVDLARGVQPLDSDALAADARAVYASPSSLYVATTEPWVPTQRGPIAPGGTAIHKFDISSPTETRYRASGRVGGVLLDQWSLSERRSVLRVASTSLPIAAGGAQAESETSVTTFAERNGSLVPLGRVGGLGKGERVYAVRFVDDVGYVVTFRQIDPLYAVDLSTPSRPVVRGSLDLRGYSAYLHPLGDGLLLGVGQDAGEDGRTLGTLASLFDVSDPAHPKRLDAFTLGRTSSQVESDHHAFLWWPRTRLAVLPVQTYLDTPFLGAVGLRVRRSGIAEIGRITHPGMTGVEPAGSPGTPITRSVVVGDTLFTVSAAGVKASALATFADRGFARLPGEEAGPPPPAPPSR